MTTLSSVCIELLGNSRTDGEKTIDGINLSPYPAIGIFFNGYGEDENTGEPTDASVEKFIVLIHKNSGKAKFSFSNSNRLQLGVISQDSSNEVEINAIYDLQTKSWHINDFVNDESAALNSKETLATLQKLLLKPKASKIQKNSNDWPFAVMPTAVKTKK